MRWQNFLKKQRALGRPFATVASDFAFLLHASTILPPDAMTGLCKVVGGKRTDKGELAAAEQLLCAHANLAVEGAKPTNAAKHPKRR